MNNFPLGYPSSTTTVIVNSDNSQNFAFSQHTTQMIPTSSPLSSSSSGNNNNPNAAQALDNLRDFLANAPDTFTNGDVIKRFTLPNGDHISCILWNNFHFITGTDIVKIMFFRFHLLNKQVINHKKFEEGIFSDLRNLKPGFGSLLEEPKSPFLEFLHRNGCIRTQKKQKVFFWRSVNHDQLFEDALERTRKREKIKGPSVDPIASSAARIGSRAMRLNPMMISVDCSKGESGTIDPASIIAFPPVEGNNNNNSFTQSYHQIYHQPEFGFPQPGEQQQSTKSQMVFHTPLSSSSSSSSSSLADSKRIGTVKGVSSSFGGTDATLESNSELIDDNLRVYFDVDQPLDQYFFGTDALCNDITVNSESWQI